MSAPASTVRPLGAVVTIDDDKLDSVRSTIKLRDTAAIIKALATELTLFDHILLQLAVFGEWVPTRDVERLVTTIARTHGVSDQDATRRLDHALDRVAEVAADLSMP